MTAPASEAIDLRGAPLFPDLARDPRTVLTPDARRVLARGAAAFQPAPFDHVVIDDFLDPVLARAVAAEHRAQMGPWIHYDHATERKRGCSTLSALGVVTRQVIGALHAPAMLKEFANLAGDGSLLADDTLEGGGLHAMGHGGFLDLHADFPSHPHRRTWQRALNLLVFLNPEWRPEWGGHLVLADGMRPVEAIAPLMNRAVIFRTLPTAYHGVPSELTTPGNVQRRSLALYFYRDLGVTAPLRATRYLPRPGDSLARRMRLRLERAALYAYALAKRYGGVHAR